MKKKRTSDTWDNQEIRILLDHYEKEGPDFCAQVLQAAGYDPRFLKEATERARAKVMISKAVTDVAKTVIQAKKALGN